MPWHKIAPDGTLSVRANETGLTDNTNYVEVTMGNTANDTTNSDVIRDHYWNVDPNFDGRHRFVNMPTYTIGGTVDDPVLGNSMQGVLYVREDSVTSEHELYYRNAGGVKQITSNIGFLAASGYVRNITTGPTLTNVYNIKTVTLVGTGNVKFEFETPFANNEYIVSGANGEGGIGWSVPEATKLPGSVNVSVWNNNGQAVSPTVFYIVVYS